MTNSTVIATLLVVIPLCYKATGWGGKQGQGSTSQKPSEKAPNGYIPNCDLWATVSQLLTVISMTADIKDNLVDAQACM